MDGEQACLELAQYEPLMRRLRSGPAEIPQPPTIKGGISGLIDEALDAAEVACVQEGQGHG